MLRPLLLIMVVFAGATTSHAAQICNRSGRYHLSYDGNFPMYIRAHSGETCEATFSNVNGSNLTFKQLLLVTPPAHGKINLRQGGYYIYSAPAGYKGRTLLHSRSAAPRTTSPAARR